ncbi:MAG: DUF1501 domain-containing protein [Pirellulaceae bacterium]|nr:DUF1501 domain-containing protein [Pirellulaceae bacterium]
MDLRDKSLEAMTRRAFFGRGATGVGVAALASLLKAKESSVEASVHFPPRAKRVIYLFMSGGPSHVDTFDYKPLLQKRDGQPMPKEIIKNHQFAMIKSDKPLVKGSPWKFSQHGQSGQWISELLPHTATVADHLAIVRSMYTETFNHDPAVSMMTSGDVRPGRPSLGAWLSYGIGSEGQDLPSFVVLASGTVLQPLLDFYWGPGFLPTRHQGVQFRRSGEPVLYVTNPAGIDSATRREQTDLLNWMNERRFDAVGDPEIQTRIAQYEMAFKMQMSVPDLTDVTTEPKYIQQMYGTKPGKNAFSNNCLLARRLIERGVRFVQLFHTGWDQHGNLIKEHQRQCGEVDQPIAALIRDLDQRGLLDETLIVCTGEFGRTPMAQGGGDGFGRDHHPHGFTSWLAGGGICGGVSYGQTDEFGYFAQDQRTHVHDLNATILHCLGVDHEQLTYRFQGRDFRLTDVHGNVIKPLLT